MKYLFVFITIFIVWVATLIIAGLLSNTDDRFSLYVITMIFTVMMYLLGFWRRA